MDDDPVYETATFAAGSFWDAEAVFRRENGVAGTRVGYTGGSLPDPTYEQVSSGSTGHVEAVQLTFDPRRISYERLLDLFWSLLDSICEPGTMTAPAIFFHSPEQKAAAETSRKRAGQLVLGAGSVEILPAARFWPAEEYHQQYYEKCSQGYGITRTFLE